MRLRQLLCLLAACVAAPLAVAAKQTVCTITINSADEQKTFRRYLPADKYDFVELVERGRPDWLRSSCEAKVSCDVLIISGHHGEGSEGNVFFSEANEAREYLPIEELERVSCSDSCPSLFANLKEVYLFGCNTLNVEPQHTVSAEITRSFVREGHAPMDAAQLAKRLGLQRGESGRDRMRLVFPNVPVIYGFASVAPLGPVAAGLLNRYFQGAGAGEVGKGHTSGRLLSQFSQHRLVATRGMATGDPLAGLRRDVCMLADDRLSIAQRADGIHQLLGGPTAQARLLIDRIEEFAETLAPEKRAQPEIAQALERIAQDTQARDRWLAFARDADGWNTRARMINLSQQLGWLTPSQRRDELVAMTGDLLARKDIAATDVNLACIVNKDHDLDGAADKLAQRAARPDGTGHSAVLACMGSTDARERVLRALVSPSESDVQIAQAYLRNRPITDASELRTVTQSIASMNAPEAQARALDVLARHYVSDRDSVATLKQLYARTRSVPVQNAIAGVLIRADRKTISASDLLPTLREHRLKAGRGDMVDALIERLQVSS
ncbi:MAG TPA: hypothetical protein VMZ74_16190 [Ramlibacter sp.]|nr:hypothetical protein [Ramlibacter sp.]